MQKMFCINGSLPRQREPRHRFVPNLTQAYNTLKVGVHVELLFEIIFEIYVELMMYIVPEEKVTSKKYRIITVVFALFVLAGVFALFIWGCVLISDYNNKLGVIPIIIAAAISIVQIISGFVFHDKKSKK